MVADIPIRSGLTGQTAIVTGAGRGIGQGIARALAEVGARVAVTNIDSSAAAVTAKALRSEGHEALRVVVDVNAHQEWRCNMEV